MTSPVTKSALESDPSIIETTVMYRKVAHIGDRVRHYGQRYKMTEGTATIRGFAQDPDTSGPWIRVLLTPDNPDDCYTKNPKGFDWDRTVVINCPHQEEP